MNKKKSNPFFYKLTEEDMKDTNLYISEYSACMIEDEDFNQYIGRNEKMIDDMTKRWKQEAEENKKKWKISELKDKRLFGFMLAPFMFFMGNIQLRVAINSFEAIDTKYPEEINAYVGIAGGFFSLFAGFALYMGAKYLVDGIFAHRELKELE